MSDDKPVQEVNGKKPNPRDVHEARQKDDKSSSDNHQYTKDRELAKTQGYGDRPEEAQSREERRQREAEINTPE